MRISDWSSDVCSSDLHDDPGEGNSANILRTDIVALLRRGQQRVEHLDRRLEHFDEFKKPLVRTIESARIAIGVRVVLREIRSEEHTSELQSLMRISYAVFCLKKNTVEVEDHNAGLTDVVAKKKPYVSNVRKKQTEVTRSTPTI